VRRKEVHVLVYRNGEENGFQQQQSCELATVSVNESEGCQSLDPMQVPEKEVKCAMKSQTLSVTLHVLFVGDLSLYELLGTEEVCLKDDTK
jgi:molybdopterin-biosynthesis enzyme MoeA-like protein